MMTTTFEPTLINTPTRHTVLRCVVCRRPFDFAADETAQVPRHITYGYDFVHDGPCLAAACDWISDVLLPAVIRRAGSRLPMSGGLERSIA